MSGKAYDEIPVEPAEATDLALHVTNCLKRHTALVKLISDSNSRRGREKIIDWIYRGLLFPAVLAVLWKLIELEAALSKFGLSMAGH